MYDAGGFGIEWGEGDTKMTFVMYVVKPTTYISSLRWPRKGPSYVPITCVLSANKLICATAAQLFFSAMVGAWKSLVFTIQIRTSREKAGYNNIL